MSNAKKTWVVFAEDGRTLLAEFKSLERAVAAARDNVLESGQFAEVFELVRIVKPSSDVEVIFLD